MTPGLRVFWIRDKRGQRGLLKILEHTQHRLTQRQKRI